VLRPGSDRGVSDPALLVQELQDAALALERASNRLVRLTRAWEGEGEGDNWRPGSQLLWLESVGNHLDRLATEYEEKEKRAPAKEILQIRAEKAAKRESPELWAEYHRLRSEIGWLQKWISAKKETISARQSSLKAERELAGMTS
jgi:hypothetical protein